MLEWIFYKKLLGVRYTFYLPRVFFRALGLKMKIVVNQR